jgi:hypothetical protein
MPGDLGRTGFGHPAVEAAIEIAGLDRRTMTTGEYQPGLDPRTACTFTIGCLSFAPEIQRSDAQPRAAEGALRMIRS